MIFTFTVGLVVPVLAAIWLVGALVVPPAPVVSNDGPVETAVPNVPAPLATEVHSAWVSQAGPASIFQDGTAELSIVFRNTGRTAWIRGTASEVRLGIVGDDASLAEQGFAIGWPLPTRPAVQAEPVVEPGATATFTFLVRGASPGRLMIRVRPVIDGAAWLEDEGAHFELYVGAVSIGAPGTT